MGGEAAGGLDVTVVLPCLDEREAVALCVKESLDALQSADLVGETLVVDNGSTDDSAAVAAAAGARVVHESRRGYGRALRTGFAQARGRVVVMADADGTYDLAKIPEMVRPILAGHADMVLATRLESSTRESMPFLHRYLGTPVITYLTARASGRRVTKDSQTGFRAFDRGRITSLGLTGDGMELASEMLIKAARSGFRIDNLEGGYRSRIGESKLDTWSDGWRHLKLILLLAPDLILVGPGAVLTILGALTLVLGFAQPSGVEIGSARWQPVFFSGIALVLGVQVLFAGAVVASSSPIARRGHHRYDFLQSPQWPKRSVGLGMALASLGLLIDVALFVAWLRDVESVPTTGIGFGFASLAQALLILGGSLAVFGVVARFTRPPRRHAPKALEDDGS